MADGLSAVRQALGNRGLSGIEVREWRQSVVLEGRAKCWQQYMEAGYAAAGKGYRGVVNDIEVEGIDKETWYIPQSRGNGLDGKFFDVVVVGGGVIGASIARELTRWDISVALVEKEEDVAKHASSRNNGMIHHGFATKAGTKKQLYNMRGNRLYTAAAAELGFRLIRPGSIALFPEKWQRLLYPAAALEAARKGVKGMRALGRSEVFALEPYACREQQGGLLFPTMGLVCPYEVTVAYAENAVENGARVFLETVVLGFAAEKGVITGVRTNRGTLGTRLVVNAAGIWADRIAELAGDRFYTIHPRKGVLAVLDKKAGSCQAMSLSMTRLGEKSHSKGGSLNPTVDGNLLAGPNAVEVPGREDFITGPQDLEFIFRRHLSLNTRVSTGDIINYFAGVRACTFEEDFIVEPSQYTGNFIHVAGIQSPGLTAAPAIAADVGEMAVNMLKNKMEVRPKADYNPRRRGRPRLASMSLPERDRQIRENPSYGRIVCRCEVISEGEIKDVLHSPLPVDSLDAVKRRARAGMGRCQGGFCTPTVIQLIAGESGRDATAVCKKEAGSELLPARTKEAAAGEVGA